MNEINLKPERTLEGYYGIKKGELEKNIKEIIKDLIDSERIVNVINKNFPRLTAEERLKIMAFHEALTIYMKLSKE